MKNALKLIVAAAAIFVIVKYLNSITTVSAFVSATPSCTNAVKNGMKILNNKITPIVHNLYEFQPVAVHTRDIKVSLDQINLYLTPSNGLITVSPSTCSSAFNAAINTLKVNSKIVANTNSLKKMLTGLPLDAKRTTAYKELVKTIKRGLGVDTKNTFKFIY
jgi:hypothetical protein